MFETGAKTHAANNLVLSVMNNGQVYADRQHCGFAMMQGTSSRVSFRDLANNEANKQRAQGCKFKAAEISEAAKLIQAQTIEHCIEMIRDEYDNTRNIEVSGRKWRDNINGNTYFSCWVRVPSKNVDYRSFAIPFQYGYGDQWQWEARRVLEKIGVIQKVDKYFRELPINWNFEGVMLKRDMYGGVYI